jgi:N-acetyl-gamma-glutamyl-phosphate reductase
MFERFTDRCRKTIALANRQAEELGHDALTPAHLVLGFLAEGTGSAAKVLRQSGVTLEAARTQVARRKPAIGGGLTAPLPQGDSFKQAILSAIEVARERGQHWIGTEHLLLGILRDSDSDGAQILAALQVNLDSIRQETDQIVHDRRDSTVMQVGIVGVSGYGGGEALRLCAAHPNFQVVYVAGEGSAGQKLSDRFPGMGRLGSLTIQKWNPQELPALDVLFASLPTGESKTALAAVAEKTKIVDIGGDHRFVEGWTYGLADIWPDKIRAATRVANPGCYASATLAALAPLIVERLIDPASIIIDAKSGVSGAGRGGGTTLGYADVNEDVSAYGLFKHAQVREITEALSSLHGSSVSPPLFTPHLIPMTRGILATCYASGSATTEQCLAVARNFYGNKPFLRIVDQPPHSKWATGSNLAFVSYRADVQRKQIIALGAIDNLGKGAAGQAVQNANLMLGLDERTGLDGAPLWP